MSAAEYADVATVLIGVAALAVAVYEGWVARRHSRLLATPNLDFWTRPLDQADRSAGLIVSVSNKGPGVAKITSVSGTIDDRHRISPIHTTDDWASFLAAAYVQLDSFSATQVDPPAWISPGESIELIRLARLKDTSVLLRLALEVRYESVFREQQTCRIALGLWHDPHESGTRVFPIGHVIPPPAGGGST